jgi:hypothetical protein
LAPALGEAGGSDSDAAALVAADSAMSVMA